MDQEFATIDAQARNGGAKGDGGTKAQALAPADKEEVCVARNGASSRFARWLIKARRMRAQFFDEHLFADPAWDILLELYALECEGRRVSVSKLSVAAGVPCTTTLRWSDKLEADGLVVRFDDPVDGRRVWIELSERGLKTMKSYVEHVAGGGNLV